MSTYKLNNNANKVEDKRNEAIDQAALLRNWDEVLRLLAQPLANVERQDREYGLLSTNWITSAGTASSNELEQLIPDHSLNPEEALIKKEEYKNPFLAIQTLTDIDQKIVIGHIMEEKSFNQLSKEVELSDKTVKSHFMKSLEALKKLI